ncbi:Hvo_1808 family surface protein [Natrialbaceae archaeon A-gly3]
MQATRTVFVLAMLALVAVSLPVAGVAATTGPIQSPADDRAGLTDRPANGTTTEEPTTEGTIGYVEGYWHDDELPVDERTDATLEEDELEAVVYRSMARVEVIRELTFQEAVPVEVITREQFQAENGESFVDLEDEELFQNVRYETLFMIDRETDAVEEYEALYSGSVAGYYDPETDEVVVVSEDEETPEMDEVILGHELLHALQDQHFDLSTYDAETLDGSSAELGLIEGDAVWVEREYERRCSFEWDCVLPAGGDGDVSAFDRGLFLTVFQPYSDGPAYVEYLLDAEDGDWDAVNDAYDDPPASSSEVIRPGEEREPVEITHEDRSSDHWERVELENRTDYASFGEVGMASMFAAPAFDDRDEIIPRDDLFGVGSGNYDYDHEYTDGWAGDKLVVYATDEETVEETGYVWHTEWATGDDAEEFLEGYLELLEVHGAETVDGHEDTLVIDESFPGAYYVDHDGETVTIVRAPSVEELSEVHAGAAPDGEDTLVFPFAADDDTLPGFGVATTALAVVVVGAMAHRR